MFGAIDAVGGWLARVAEALRRGAARQRGGSHATLDGNEPASILLVQLDHLGDAVLTTALLESLRRRFPTARLEVLAAPWNRAVFEASRCVDHIIVCRHNRFRRSGGLGWIVATIAWGIALRHRRYDVAIDVRGEAPLALLMWLAGARRRVGWPAGGGGFLLTDAIEYVHGRAEVASRAAIMAAFDPQTSAPIGQPRLAASHASRRQIDARVLADFDRRGELFVMHIGAGTTAKRWPTAHWRALIGRMLATTKAGIVVVAANDDRAAADEACAGFSPARVRNWAGQTALDDLVALVGRASLFIGADSGPAHVAAAAGTPVVVLFSGTNNHVQWAPPGENVVVVRQHIECSPCHRSVCFWRDHPCMTQLSPAAVHAAAARLLPELFDRAELGPSRGAPPIRQLPSETKGVLS